jgi:hypothetical protein
VVAPDNDVVASTIFSILANGVSVIKHLIDLLIREAVAMQLFHIIIIEGESCNFWG